jgi:hypothetical protein
MASGESQQNKYAADDAAKAPAAAAGGQSPNASATSRRAFVNAAAAASLGGLLLTLSAEEAKAVRPAFADGTEPELVWTAVTDYDSGAALDQGTYSPRFTAYLARFLINYDAVSAYWWDAQQTRVSAASAQALSRRLVEEGADTVFASLDLDNSGSVSEDEFYAGLADQTQTFAKFQASVAYGLRKYQGKDGVKALFRLIVEEFGETVPARRQIALLFSLMENNQPVELIKRLIAETDNGSVLSYTVTYGGSGYTAGNPPAVKVDSPPFLDDTATAKAVLKPTGRIFRVKLTAAGKGYAKAPEVTITPPRAVGGRAATAICTLKGDKLAGIVVTNPGQVCTQSYHTAIPACTCSVSTLVCSAV